MCGMCLPHCPTYQLYQTETESPRGRIALMQSIDQARIEVDVAALKHIDHCLGCLNCETICPSRVPYGSLIDEFRQQYSKQIRKSFFSRQILNAAGKPGGLKQLSQQSSNIFIRPFLNLAGTLPWVPIVPKASKLTLDIHYPASNNVPQRGSVTLFTGCSSQQMDSQTLHDACILLNHLGYRVNIPPSQPCCGALHQHNGEMQVSAELLQQQHEFLNTCNDDAIVLFSSPACGASLKQVDEARFLDIRSFLLKQLTSATLEFEALQKPVALHESCSGRNMLKSNGVNQQLLELIPELQIIYSSQPALCCGAGGLQSFNYPQQAQALAEKKLQSFVLSETDILLSDNIGCSMHIKNTLNRYNHKIDVLHPLSLLRRQLRIS